MKMHIQELREQREIMADRAAQLAAMFADEQAKVEALTEIIADLKEKLKAAEAPAAPPPA